jgi:2-polyprenyl-3-methyl-5-hydroxy-6-metoxy-1,4-benzoquinol methylase
MANISFHKLPHIKVISNRDNFILNYCTDKNVLHLGCVGSLRCWDKGSPLHLKLLSVAKRVIGIDINKEKIEYLRKKGISDLICFDVEKLDQIEISTSIDVIIAGEILEHLPNPGLCLSSTSRLMNKNAVFIITLPNAFSLRNFLSVMVNKKELVRDDHNFYFSYITLKALLKRYNFTIVNFLAYSNLRDDLMPLKRFIKKVFNCTIFRFSPFTAEGLIAIAKRRDHGSSKL